MRRRACRVAVVRTTPDALDRDQHPVADGDLSAATRRWGRRRSCPAADVVARRLTDDGGRSGRSRWPLAGFGVATDAGEVELRARRRSTWQVAGEDYETMIDVRTVVAIPDMVGILRVGAATETAHDRARGIQHATLSGPPTGLATLPPYARTREYHPKRAGDALPLPRGPQMSVRRVMGTETEFGISVQGHPHANPMVASTRLVNAYATATLKARRARWDFEEESPLRDARGFDMSREVADPSQLTDEDLGLANVILTNGARLYVDHAHPEYSTPECTTPLDIVSWDKAGEQIALDACRFASVSGEGDLLLYKNNTDNKGASYGAHENYLVRRSTPVRRHRAPPDPVLRQPPGRLRRRPGRARAGRPRRRVPDQPARGLLRGGGRARDHAQAPDHQHPRRAARRPGEVPPPARDPRRRQPLRDLHLPQGRAPPRWS